MTVEKKRMEGKKTNRRNGRRRNTKDKSKIFKKC